MRGYLFKERSIGRLLFKCQSGRCLCSALSKNDRKANCPTCDRKFLFERKSICESCGEAHYSSYMYCKSGSLFCTNCIGKKGGRNV